MSPRPVPDRCFPPLKSNPVHVVREDPAEHPAPMHVSNTFYELILLICGINFPWQFTYQFAHELIHLLARSNLRFGQPGRHIWIEEALTGAGSLYALQKMAAEGGPDLKQGAADYLADGMAWYSADGVNRDWFSANRVEILASTGETSLTAKIATAIVDGCPDGTWLFDNRALIGTPLNADLDQATHSYCITRVFSVKAPKCCTILRVFSANAEMLCSG
jgi:hypothetical protein